MRYPLASSAAFTALPATPALAHHEVVMVTSALPLMVGVTAIAAGAWAAWRQRLSRGKRR